MKFDSLTRVATIALCGIASSIALPAGAKEIRYDAGLPSSHVGNVSMQHVIDNLPAATDGALTAKNYYGALQKATEASHGLQSGILDMGSILTPFYPSDFPIGGFLSELPALADSAVAITGAAMETNLIQCKPCFEEYITRNQLPLTMFGTGSYQII